MNKSAA